jgi:hypothetical protein
MADEKRQCTCGWSTSIEWEIASTWNQPTATERNIECALSMSISVILTKLVLHRYRSKQSYGDDCITPAAPRRSLGWRSRAAIFLAPFAVPHTVYRTSGRIEKLDGHIVRGWIWAQVRIGCFVRSFFVLYTDDKSWRHYDSGEVFLGTWNNTQVALKVLATGSGIMTNPMVCDITWYFNLILISNLQAIRQEIEVRHWRSQCCQKNDILQCRHGRRWGIHTSYVTYSIWSGNELLLTCCAVFRVPRCERVWQPAFSCDAIFGEW